MSTSASVSLDHGAAPQTEADDAEQHDEDHRRQRRQRDHPKTVDQRIAPPDRAREAYPEGGDQRHRHGRGRHPARVEGDADDRVGRDERQPTTTDVAADDQILNRPPLEDPEHADQDRDPHRQRHRQPELEGVGRHRLIVGSDESAVRGDLGCLAGDGNERRFSHGG